MGPFHVIIGGLLWKSRETNPQIRPLHSDQGMFPLLNTMQREGDSPKQSDPESTSIFPRFILNCMGCCVPSCFTKPKSTDEDEDPRSPISGPITKEPVGKPKAHDSGEDEEFSSGSSTDRLAGFRSVRGMQLRRRQGVSPPRPSSEPKVVSYVSGLLQKSRRENSGDPKELISEIPRVQRMERQEEVSVLSPMVIQDSQDNVYKSDVSQEHSTHVPTTETTSTSTSTTEQTSSEESSTTSTVSPQTSTPDTHDFVVVGGYETDEDDFFIVNGDP